LGQLETTRHTTFEWLKISNITVSSKADHHLNWSVYSSPKPSDIEQGALGDCWLMAALTLITERPEMLEHIILTKTINNEGIYLVRLCHNGLWKTILIDDCFPCTQSRHLAFSQANRRQLYVPLIEKACAKLFGSYADLTGGHTQEGLQLLTGAPCDHIQLNPTRGVLDSDLAWAKLLSACESK
jgi:calpain-15